MHSMQQEVVGPVEHVASHAENERLSWPAATVVIGALSLLGWAGIGVLVRLAVG